MTPYDQGQKFYKEQWTATIVLFAREHFFYSSPTCIVLAIAQDGGWFIEFLAGDMKEALGKLPFWLPEIRFYRRGKPRSYWTAKITNKLLHDDDVSVKGCVNDSVQDGFTDPLPVWRWWRWQDQTASTACTNYCRRECGQESDSGSAA